MNKLYGYWRSSAAYRVRIALNYKGLDVEHIPVHLVKNGGEQHGDAYVAINPSHLVPTFTDREGLKLAQSVAILEYLQDTYPTPTLLPFDPKERAIVRSMVAAICSDIHPLNNLRVLKYLSAQGFSDEQKSQWYQHWVSVGFETVEAMLQQYSGQYSFGDQLSFADVCLIPQVYNAKRFNIDLSPYPLIEAIYARCCELSAFAMAAPEQQADAGA
ncbi:maleylacetoacetate isomerase [Paraferrimonas haliotis]|uniref:maleylacetoacetate isomerase n=1 Tax=Paraferrimonas haliotis TaxID=2013866 RepID=UPI000BA8D7E9|nr:maleylacetoacetate isomerase [Paraferrimonas haliotis]